MDDNTKNIMDVIINSIQVIIILASALWAYFRFRKEDPLHPRIEFDIRCEFFGPQQDAYLASFSITADNKGNVEHTFKEIRLKVLGIENNTVLTENKDYPPMVNFPVKIMDKVNIVPKKFGYFFVRPGVNQTFNYATQIPGNIRFIVARATFRYKSSNDLHTAQRVFEVK